MQYTVNYTTKDWKIHELENIRVNIENEEYSCGNWEDYAGERECDPFKIDIRKHRNYNFQHDFDIDWEILDLEEDFKKYTPEELEEDYEYSKFLEEKKKLQDIEEKYYVFELDFFDHSAIGFSLACRRINLWYYNMDRSCNVWIVAVEKSIAKDEIDAEKQCKQYIEEYNNYCNGWIMEYSIEEKDLYYSKDENKDPIENWEVLDSCGWFLHEEYAIDYTKDYLSYILKERNIEYEKIELV